MMKNETRWYEYHYKVLALARHLHDEQGLDVEQILYLMEKPWKYSEEWKELTGSEEE